MPATRLSIPTLRECPADVLRHIREVDAQAELVYMGDAKWLLGSVSLTNVRERVGRYKLRKSAEARIVGNELQQRRLLARWRYIAWEGALLTQGFAPIALFDQHDPDSRMSEYLREREYAWRGDLDAAYRRSLQDADGDDIESDVAISSYFDEHKLREGYRRMVKVLRPARSVLVSQTLKSA